MLMFYDDEDDDDDEWMNRPICPHTTYEER